LLAPTIEYNQEKVNETNFRMDKFLQTMYERDDESCAQTRKISQTTEDSKKERNNKTNEKICEKDLKLTISERYITNANSDIHMLMWKGA
jgi:sensor c-di-GMP phosphodiesterase-like protein